MNSIRKLASFARPYTRQMILAPLLMVVEVTMDLLQPSLMERIIDIGIAQLDMSLVLNMGLLMLAAALLGALGGIGCSVYTVRASQGFGADLRSALYTKVQSLSFSNLDELKTGHLITCLTNDVTQIQTALTMLLRALVRMPLLVIGSLIMAAITSLRLALLLFVLAPFVVLLLVLVIRRAHPMFYEVQDRLDKVNSVMQENLAGVRVVKAFARGEHEKQRFGVTNDRLMEKTTQALRLMAVLLPIMILLVDIGVAGALWIGGVQVDQGNLQVGQIMAFINYLLQVMFSLMMVGMLLVHLTRAQASADRVVEVLETEPTIKNREDALMKFSTQGRIAFENVSFGYDGNADSVLRNVSFVAEPGQTVAILGATGSGKSTLTHLIPRFYDVNEGRVTLDGLDVRDVTKEALRASIGMALQESILFSGTIRDNIRYGRPDATDEEVLEAAKIAQAHDFVMSLPDGYDTVLGQRGVNLSGGQKQRLAIARALVRKPAVLILDDSTSAVDVDTEAQIWEALQDLMAGRTSIVVAQRISTVLNADKILLLDDGNIVAEGTHEELMKSSTIYREIYDSQLGNGANKNG